MLRLKCTKFDFCWGSTSDLVGELTQRRNDGVAAASSDGGPTGGRGPRQFWSS